MMKKLGFTLVEVLIALALVGVVSALTLPTLVSANQQKANAAALSTAVSNFETAMRSMMVAEDVTELYDTEAWKNLPNNGLRSASSNANTNQFMANINEYFELSRQGTINNLYGGAPNIKRVNSNNLTSAPTTLMISNKKGFVSNNGMFFMIEANKQNNSTHIPARRALTAGVNLTDIAGRVIIDVNGAKSPNKVGRDVFYFVLGADGVLYPFGSKDVEYYLSNGANVDMDWSSNGATYSCADNNIANDGIGCTARLIENGYKMDY